MPHFTLQVGPQGPMLQGLIGLSKARRDALAAAGQPIVAPVPIIGLVDTGASCTSVDPSVLNSLGLSPTGKANILTPSTGNTPQTVDQYDVLLAIPPGVAAHLPLVFDTIPVIAADLLAAQGFHALIGRDILANCVLHYNGSMRLFTLAY